MKNIKYFVFSSSLALVPFVAGATDFDADGTAQTFLSEVLDFINDVLIPFVLGIAFLFFVWGIFQYFIAGGANDEAKEKGKSLITYAIIGFVVILVFWGLVNLLTSATGLDGDDAPTDIPVGPTIP